MSIFEWLIYSFDICNQVEHQMSVYLDWLCLNFVLKAHHRVQVQSTLIHEGGIWAYEETKCCRYIYLSVHSRSLRVNKFFTVWIREKDGWACSNHVDVAVIPFLTLPVISKNKQCVVLTTCFYKLKNPCQLFFNWRNRDFIKSLICHPSTMSSMVYSNEVNEVGIKLVFFNLIK